VWPEPALEGDEGVNWCGLVFSTSLPAPALEDSEGGVFLVLPGASYDRKMNLPPNSFSLLTYPIVSVF